MVKNLTNYLIDLSHGDEKTIGPIYDTCLRMARKFTRGDRMLDPEEIANEAAIKICAKINSYNPDYAGTTWAGAIIINIIRDHKRKNKSEKGKLLSINTRPAGRDMSWEIVDRKTTSPIEELISLENNLLARAAVSETKLSEQERRLIYLSSEHPHRSTSEYLGIPIGTVKSNLHRAREKVRKTASQVFD